MIVELVSDRMNLLNKESQAIEDIFGNLKLVELVLLSLELTDQIKHSPWMSRFNIDPLKHLTQQEVSCLLVVTFEDNGGHKIDKVACYGIGVSDQVEGKFDHFLLQFSFEWNDNVLNKNMLTVRSFLEVVTEIWDSYNQAK